MINFSIVFDHRNRASSTEKGPVEIRVTVDRKPYYVTTGIRVYRDNFVGGSITGQADAEELNTRLAIIYRRVQEEANRYVSEGRELDVAAIRRKAWSAGKEEQNRDTALIDFIEEQEGMMNLKVGTLKHYRTLRYRLKAFGQMMRWEDVTVENICRFDAWLHRQKVPLSDADKKSGKPEKALGDGAVYNYHKCLKAILNRAVLFGRMDGNPYERLRGKFKRGEKESVEFLTMEEMEAVESLHPVKGTMMAVARDLFVFQMHTGLSYADTQAFDFSQYHKVDGRWVTVGNRVKTGVQYVTQLSEECERILGRYGWKLPKIGNADYNHCLKALGAAVGIEKPLHSHLARHSFATKMTAGGAAIQNVARMLGHSSVVHTQRYAKVLPESVFADFQKVEQLTGKKRKK